MRDEDGMKWLPAARLVELLATLLATLPGDSRVMPNDAGDLLVLTADGARRLAYVDLSGVGEVVPFTTEV